VFIILIIECIMKTSVVLNTWCIKMVNALFTVCIFLYLYIPNSYIKLDCCKLGKIFNHFINSLNYIILLFISPNKSNDRFQTF